MDALSNEKFPAKALLRGVRYRKVVPQNHSTKALHHIILHTVRLHVQKRASTLPPRQNEF